MPISLREEAADMADNDGISFNQFICLAIAEKLTRIRRKALQAEGSPTVLPIAHNHLEQQCAASFLSDSSHPAA